MGLLVRVSPRFGFYDPLFHAQKCILHDGKFSVLDHMDFDRHCEYVCYLLEMAGSRRRALKDCSSER